MRHAHAAQNGMRHAAGQEGDSSYHDHTADQAATDRGHKAGGQRELKEWVLEHRVNEIHADVSTP
jgi:hypothetical protein